MIKLFTYTPKLLQHGHIIHFSPGFDTGEVARYGGKYYRVQRPQQVYYDTYYILPNADYKDIDISNAASGTENLYPDRVDEIYEILFGFKGSAIILPIIPSPSTYFQKLGYTAMIPDVTSDTLKYLGGYKEKDTPYEAPKLRLTFMKHMDPMILRTLVDIADDYDKITFSWLVNRCMIKEITPTAEEKSVARTILHHTELSRSR